MDLFVVLETDSTPFESSSFGFYDKAASGNVVLTCTLPLADSLQT